MQLLRKKKPLTGESDAPEATRTTDAVRGEPVNTAKPEEGVKSPELLKDVVLTAVRKDVFIAHGARLSGLIEAESNVVTEGCIEGNILSTHQVRVDSGGVVKGDIRAVHIIVNGLVTGRCYAQAVTLQEQGRIEGDVFTDEFAIERGGVFIGQSCLPPAPAETPEPVKGGRDTARATARSEELRGASTRKAPQPLSNQPEGGTASAEVSE